MVGSPTTFHTCERCSLPLRVTLAMRGRLVRHSRIRGGRAEQIAPFFTIVLDARHESAPIRPHGTIWPAVFHAVFDPQDTAWIFVLRCGAVIARFPPPPSLHQCTQTRPGVFDASARAAGWQPRICLFGCS